MTAIGVALLILAGVGFLALMIADYFDTVAEVRPPRHHQRSTNHRRRCRQHW